MKKIRKAVIPCAGLGTRLLPVTKVVPKELLPIGSKPIVQYVVEEAVASGLSEIIFVLSPGKQAIAEYFRELFLPFEIRVAEQPEPLGLGHAILCAREAVGEEPFVVLLPDVLIDSTLPASRQLLEAAGEGWGVLLERVGRERVGSYGVIKGARIREGLYRLEGAVEKPRPEEAPSDLSILGRYLLPPEIFGFIQGAKGGALGEIQLTDAIDHLAQESAGLGLVCEGRVFDVGSVEGMRRAWREFGQGRR